MLISKDGRVRVDDDARNTRSTHSVQSLCVGVRVCHGKQTVCRFNTSQISGRV